MDYRFFILLVAAVVLSSCTILSKNPVGPISEAAVDQELVGSWEISSKKGPAFVHIFPKSDAEGRFLEILFVGRINREPGWLAAEGHVTVTADRRRYLNLVIVNGGTEDLAYINDRYLERKDHPYSFVPYRFDGTRLLIGLVPTKYLRDDIKSGVLAGDPLADSEERSAGWGILTVLDDSSESIQKSLLNIPDSDLFVPGATLELQRIADKPPS